MPTPFQLVLGVAVLVGLGVLFLFGRRLAGAFLRYRGTRVVVCPENREMVAVRVDAGARGPQRPAGPPRPAPRVLHALAREGGLRPGVPRPDRVGPRGLPPAEHPRRLVPGQELRVLRPLLPRHPLARPQARPPRARTGAIVAWDAFRAEQVVDVLATHKPVCWDCRVAESFRREHPELVTDRPPRPGPPPSMA